MENNNKEKGLMKRLEEYAVNGLLMVYGIVSVAAVFAGFIVILALVLKLIKYLWAIV